MRFVLTYISSHSVPRIQSFYCFAYGFALVISRAEYEKFNKWNVSHKFGMVASKGDWTWGGGNVFQNCSPSHAWPTLVTSRLPVPPNQAFPQLSAMSPPFFNVS